MTEAATDNLTELMRGGGSGFASVLLAVWWFVVGLVASLLARALVKSKARFVMAILFMVVSVPVGWFLLMGGTEPAVHKYGEVFSALQFLLSESRSDYVQDTVLMTRYAIAHISLVILMGLSQYPFVLWINKGRPAIFKRIDRSVKNLEAA